ncbi:MAG: crossover junction endodeoxyribonuclease RuvC [Candidatus Blackburnbacteria bacterium]|nr:crossover junction endodeoxyribonuclease RuvC [Candidatus Blackburnbacteria bacterium]
MRVLGIDPGTATTGYGFLETNGDGTPYLRSYGWIETKDNGDPAKRLVEIYNGIKDLLSKHSPDVVAMERLFFFSNQRTAMRVSQAQGIFLLAAAQKNIPLFEYPPGQVKLKIAGSGRADKKLMQETIKEIFNIKAPDKKKTHFDDVADAIAIALCHIRVKRETQNEKRDTQNVQRKT